VCVWCQMTFHYACGTCAEFVITLRNEDVKMLQQLKLIYTIQYTFDWKDLWTLLFQFSIEVLYLCRQVFTHQSTPFLFVFYLMSNCPCCFNYKANKCCLLRKCIDRNEQSLHYVYV